MNPLSEFIDADALKLYCKLATIKLIQVGTSSQLNIVAVIFYVLITELN